MVIRVRLKLRRLTAKSWLLSRCYFRCRGTSLLGRPQDQIWYFAYGANMHDATFRVRRAYNHGSTIPAASKGTASGSISMVGPGVDLHPLTYTLTRTEKSGACSTA